MNSEQSLQCRLFEAASDSLHLLSSKEAAEMPANGRASPHIEVGVSAATWQATANGDCRIGTIESATNTPGFLIRTVDLRVKCNAPCTH